MKGGEQVRAGFIGLGGLGKAMARRLISEGVKLVVWNRSREKTADLDVEVAESPADVLARVETVFMCLFDSAAVEAVITGRGGFIESDFEGERIVIDATTNHFDAATRFHRILRDIGVSYLESPVLGSVVPASRGALTILVSGEKASYEKSRPLFEMIGANIFYLDAPGQATKMKLVNNLVLGAFMGAIAEAVAYGEAVGLDRAAVIDVLGAGAGNSAILAAKRDKLLNQDFSTHFSSALMYKDLHLMQDLARSLGLPLFMGSAAKELFAMAFPRKLEGHDFSVVYQILKEQHKT